MEDLRPYAKVILGAEGEVTIEDNFPEDYEGRSVVASMLYGAFQAMALEAQKIEPKIEIPTPEQVSKLVLP